MAVRALWHTAGWLMTVGALTAGCAVLIPTPTRPPSSAPTSQPAMPEALQGLLDLRGAIELHSRYSHDGTTPVPVIAAIAQRMGLDFLMITDHNNLLAQQHEHDSGPLIVMAGSELSTTAGHLLALGIRQPVSKDQPVEHILEQIHAQGGLAFVSDPTNAKKPWQRWELPVDGLVIFDVNHRLVSHPLVQLVAGALFLPNSTFWTLATTQRPDDTLSIWDRRSNAGQPLVGIASHDTHAHLGLRPWLLDTFQSGFRLLSTHVLVQERTAAALYDGLRRGRCYVALDGLAAASPFVFAIRHQQGWALMGDRIPWQEGLTASVQLPQDAHCTLVRNGHIVSTQRGRTCRWPIVEPGIYRVEVTRRGRLWILSNPIIVEPSS